MFNRYPLISPEEYAGLPEDPVEAFIELERICRFRLLDIADESKNGASDDRHLEYISRVAAAAWEFGIQGGNALQMPSTDEYDYRDFRAFSQQVAALLTRLQIRVAKNTSATSVALRDVERSSLLVYINNLREQIKNAGLTEERCKLLLKKLDELQDALEGRRISFTKVMIAIAAFAGAVTASEQAIIKAPETVAAVVKLLGQAKAQEDAAREPPKSIEDQTRTRLTFADANDPDEIPLPS